MTGARNFARDEAGSGLPEFAVVLPVMITMLLGILDLSYREYSIAVLQGAVQKAARDGALQAGAAGATAIDNIVVDLFQNVNKTLPRSAYTFTRRNFSSLTRATRLEPADGPNGRCAPPPAAIPPAVPVPYRFTDWNGNGIWDDGGGAGQGNASDAVLYTVTVQYDGFFPVGRLIGMPERQTITASTVLRNQPYANQVQRVDSIVTMNCPTTSPYYPS